MQILNEDEYQQLCCSVAQDIITMVDMHHSKAWADMRAKIEDWHNKASQLRKSIEATKGLLSLEIQSDLLAHLSAVEGQLSELSDAYPKLLKH